VRWVDFDAIDRLASETGMEVERRWSFPFPRLAGRAFPYNEFVAVLRVAGSDHTPRNQITAPTRGGCHQGAAK
jgi:hypothetical protein